jgi:hypothetical protein
MLISIAKLGPNIQGFQDKLRFCRFMQINLTNPSR